MPNFEIFVHSLQSAIVNSSEAIRKRNELILEEYFYKETSEVILENKEYNKQLYSLIQPVRTNNIVSEFLKNEKLNVSHLSFQKQEMLSSNSHISKEDELLAEFLFEAYNFAKKNNISKLLKSNNLEVIKDSKLYDNVIDDLILKENTSKELILKEINAIKEDLAQFENEIRKLDNVKSELFNTKQLQILELEDIKIKLKDSTSGELKKWESKFITLNKFIDKTTIQIAENDSKINLINIEYDNQKNKLEHCEQKLQSVINTISNYEMSQLAYFKQFLDIIQQSYDIVQLIKSSKKDVNNIIELIKNSKRYVKKKIESLVPKTVRVNYPTTFDFATPDNDKEYKTVSTPVEVPLLTLVPIGNYNIEKATFKANFKFDMIEDQVMIDFSKDVINENEQANNYGNLEIVLSPQQTPEGLRSLIESYENFLKRQII